MRDGDASIASIDMFLEHVALELRRARNQVADTAASALAIVLVAAVFAFGVKQLSFPPQVQLLLQPTLMLLQFVLIVLALRALTIALSDCRELAVLTSEFGALAHERDGIKERSATTVEATDSAIVLPVIDRPRSGGPILRVD